MTFFNSRNPIYRSPTGAVQAGTRVHFKITVPRSMACSAAYLLIQDADGRTVCCDMFWCGMNGDDHEWWECHFAPQHAGLCFYHFELRTSRGHSVLKKDIGGEARSGGSEDWQLTVYAADFKTPDWLAGGVLYQIFPDRFCSSGEKKQDVPYGRTMHGDWYEQPEWRPNAAGEITNSDFFGGDLKGIEQKLGYLESLGVTCIYLNPIFESHSNHRYDTANYEKIDPLLGTEADFRALCTAAKARGIRILLDGVFSHTGSDSIYFNREGRYGDGGAYRSQQSPYYPWYSFRRWPDDYECWWNFITLPNVREGNPAYDAYINGESGIIRRWLEAGAAGWRLDVADELPDCFIDSLNRAVKGFDENALVLGEVWEDASNKTAYGVRRRYLMGGQLDSVMNYPFRAALRAVCVQPAVYPVQYRQKGGKPMDQAKIGRFIAARRKAQGLTQRQLADALSISDKTVSKWECGKGLPEVSLMLPLCGALQITVNDLLTGAVVSETDYRKRAEENMMNLMRENEENKRRMMLSVLCGAITIIAVCALAALAAFAPLPAAARIALLLLALATAAAGVFAAAMLDVQAGYYKCPHCGALFAPTFGEYVKAYHTITRRRLTCPHCGEKGLCRKQLRR